MRRKGLLIVVDGPSASGKDSVIQRALKDLRKLAIKIVSIHETKEKDYDREKILSVKELGDKKTADAIIDERKKIYQTKIIPQLLAGKFIVANRGEPSTLAYQTLKQEITMEEVWEMHRNAGVPLPDLAIILNCGVKEAIRRESFKKLSNEDKKGKSMGGKFTKSLAEREQVHGNYEKVKDFLKRKGLSVIYLQNDALHVQEESEIILNYLKNKINYSYE